MALDTSTLAAIGVGVAKQIKDEVVAGLEEAGADITAQDRPTILQAVEQIGQLAARKYAGEDVTAELAQWQAVVRQYQDIAAQVARRVTEERLENIAEEVARAALKAGEAILQGLVPV